MAQSPLPRETKELLRQTHVEEEEKRKAQEAEDKEFVNHGQGVIPEEVWTNLPGKQEEQGE